MIEITLIVPSSKEECERKGFPCYNCDLRSVTNCVVFRDHVLEEHETFTSAKETSKVTYEDIKESVEELRKQKEKIERLQKEFIEEEVKNNPKFMGYYVDNVKKQLSLYGLPIYPDSSTDKNTFTFHDKKRSDIQRMSDAEGTIYNLDGKGKKISLKEMIEKHEKKGVLREKPELSKRVNSRKVVLRENFC